MPTSLVLVESVVPFESEREYRNNPKLSFSRQLYFLPFLYSRIAKKREKDKKMFATFEIFITEFQKPI